MHISLGNLQEVAVVGIVFGVPFAFAALIFFLRHQQKIERERTVRLALEKGEKLSPEVLQVLQSTLQKQDNDRSGLPSAVFAACVMVGVGCIVELEQFGTMIFFFLLALGFVLRAVLSARERANENKKV